MNTTRQQAERTYQAALTAVRAAESGRDEQAWLAAEAALSVARRALIDAEAKYPTAKETKRAANVLRLRNRGLDC
jgi:hypothetical protein